MSDETHVITQQPISQNTIVAQVMAHIKELIAGGKYRPGDRLPTEQELATLFGVGRSSIREAIKVFQHMGIVESKAAKGTFVQDRANISLEAITWALLLGDDDLRDVFELREAIELMSFRRAATKLQKGDPAGRQIVDQLKEHVATMHRAAEANDQTLLADADYQFHLTIISASENRLFVALYQTLQAFMKNEIRRTYYRIESLKAVAADHQEIVGYLEDESIDRSVDRHSQHFRRIRRLLGLPKKPVEDV